MTSWTVFIICGFGENRMLSPGAALLRKALRMFFIQVVFNSFMLIKDVMVRNVSQLFPRLLQLQSVLER